jgi:beta-RFAP synthase
MIVHVKAPSRLHFGMLHVPGKETTPKDRSFGGVGLMIDQPGIELFVQPSPTWKGEGPEADRALAIGQTVLQSFPHSTIRAAHLLIRNCAPQHQGLGTGTQLSSSVARALVELLSHDNCDSLELARLTGRGKRSALGIHGFQSGGFIVDGGKLPETLIAPQVARVDFPDEWRVVLVMTPLGSGVHGPAERAVFEHLQATEGSDDRTDRLCRLVLLGMLPALVEKDYPAFCASLTEFNARAGEPFVHFQRIQSNQRMHAICASLQDLGIQGVGQSSWGPAVFGVAKDEECARHAARKIAVRFSTTAEEVLVTKANNRGASVLVSNDPA